MDIINNYLHCSVHFLSFLSLLENKGMVSLEKLCGLLCFQYLLNLIFATTGPRLFFTWLILPHYGLWHLERKGEKKLDGQSQGKERSQHWPG